MIDPYLWVTIPGELAHLVRSTPSADCPEHLKPAGMKGALWPSFADHDLVAVETKPKRRDMLLAKYAFSPERYFFVVDFTR